MDTGFGIGRTTTTFKSEGACYDTNGQCAQGTSDTGHYWCCTGSGTATFARGHKDHVCTFQGSFNFVDVVFSCLPPNLWVGTGTKSTSEFSTNVQFHFSRGQDRKSTRLNSSHVAISYAVFCLKKKKRH